MSFDQSNANTSVPQEGALAGVLGSLSSAFVVPDGLYGNAAFFPQSLPSATLLLTPPISINATVGWTASAWVKNLYPNTMYRTLFRGYLGHHPVLTNQYSNNLGTWDSGGGSFRPSGYAVTPLVDGSWHHIAAVGLSGQTRFYINGSFVGTAAFASSTDIYSVGNDQSGGQPFSSYIDEVRVWNRALSDAEMASLHAAVLCGQTAANCPVITGSATTTTTSDSTRTSTTTTATTTVPSTCPAWSTIDSGYPEACGGPNGNHYERPGGVEVRVFSKSYSKLHGIQELRFANCPSLTSKLKESQFSEPITRTCHREFHVGVPIFSN